MTLAVGDEVTLRRVRGLKSKASGNRYQFGPGDVFRVVEVEPPLHTGEPVVRVAFDGLEFRGVLAADFVRLLPSREVV